MERMFLTKILAVIRKGHFLAKILAVIRSRHFFLGFRAEFVAKGGCDPQDSWDRPASCRIDDQSGSDSPHVRGDIKRLGMADV